MLDQIAVGFKRLTKMLHRFRMRRAPVRQLTGGDIKIAGLQPFLGKPMMMGTVLGPRLDKLDDRPFLFSPNLLST